MQIQKIDCPSCGASLSVPENGSKVICSYCGKEIILESKVIENVGNKVSSSFKEEESKTQLEIKRLQSAQELSMLQMQLANLRSERRNLERYPSKSNYYHMHEIAEEEAQLNKRIAIMQNSLLPSTPFTNATQQSSPQSSSTNPNMSSPQPPRINNNQTPYSANLVYEQPAKSWGTTILLAVFLGFCGAHRFYTGRIGTALLYLFTLGLGGIGWTVDVLLILCNKFKDSKGRPLNNYKKVGFVFAKILGGILLWFIGFAILASTKWVQDDVTGEHIAVLGLFILPLIIVILLNHKFFIKKVGQIRNNISTHFVK